MTYDEWRETYFSGPLMNEAMARAAWSAAKAIEREACAKIADSEIAKYQPGAPFNQLQSGIFTAAEHIAEAIRARGQQ